MLSSAGCTCDDPAASAISDEQKLRIFADDEVRRVAWRDRATDPSFAVACVCAHMGRILHAQTHFDVMNRRYDL
eukprot:COSAG02_NODE_11674_length_1676_cov_1.520609_2_plen_74_part_00